MITVVIDCETTGLTAPSCLGADKQPRIIEFAAARLEDGALVSEHSWLLNPGHALPPEIVKITGLKDEQLRDAPTFAAALPEIRAALAGADQLIAHNAPFDVACLQYELERCGAAQGFPWPALVLCTVQEYVHEFGHKPKLTELYERKMGCQLAQEHRALSDVRALVEIVMAEGLV